VLVAILVGLNFLVFSFIWRSSNRDTDLPKTPWYYTVQLLLQQTSMSQIEILA